MVKETVVKDEKYIGENNNRETMPQIFNSVRSGWFGKMNDIMTIKSMLLHLKKKYFDQCMLPAIIDTPETWTVNIRMIQKLWTAQKRMERTILGITKREMKTI